MSLFLRLITYGILFTCTRMLVGGFASLYLLQHSMTVADISFLKAFQGIIIIMLQVPIGYWIDKCKNRYPFVLFSIGLSAIWLLLTGLGHTAADFYIAEIFNAISLAIFNAVMIPILVETYNYVTGNDDYNYVLGKFFKYQNILMGISVVLGGLFIEISSRKIWFIACGILTSLLVYSLVTNDLKRFSLNINKTTNKKIKHHFKDVLFLFKKNEMIFLFIANIGLLTLFQILAQFWQIVVFSYLGEEFTHALTYCVTFAIILLLQSIASLLAEYKSSVKLSIFFTFSICASCFYLLSQSKYHQIHYEYIPLFLLVFFLFKYPSVIVSALIHKGIINSIRSTFDSCLGVITMIFSILSFYLIGVFLDQYGDVVIFYSLELLGFISFLSLFLYHSLRRTDAAPLNLPPLSN